MEDRPRFLFEPGRVRVGARSVGGIKQGGGAGRGGGAGGGKGRGQGRGQGAAFADFGTLVSAFGAIASSRGVVPSPPEVASLTLISSTTLVADGTFDVSGISGSYNDLLVVLIARSTVVANTDNPTVRFNNDSAANYNAQRLRAGNSTALTADSTSGATGGGIRAEIPAASATAGLFGYLELTIPGYASTAWTKQFFWQEAAAWLASAQFAGLGGAIWNSTAAITRIQISSGVVGNLLAGSQLRIYGRL